MATAKKTSKSSGSKKPNMKDLKPAKDAKGGVAGKRTSLNRMGKRQEF